MTTQFNRFATELSLERFKQRYDAGKIGAYVGDRGPGTEDTRERTRARLRAQRKTPEGMRHEVRAKHAEDTSLESRNDAWPTASELTEVAEKLEAYLQKLSGQPVRPSVRLGMNNAYTSMPRSPVDDRGVTNCWSMPLENLQVRIAKQRALVTKWQWRLAQAEARGDKPRTWHARKRVRETSAKLVAAEAVLTQRESEKT